MRCKNYTVCRNITPSPTGHKCWEKWQLCGACAVAEHPEEYPKIKLIQRTYPFWTKNGRNARILKKELYKRVRWPYSGKYSGQKTKHSYAITTLVVGVASSVAVKQRQPTYAIVRCVVRRLRGTKSNKKVPLNGRKVARKFWDSAYHFTLVLHKTGIPTIKPSRVLTPTWQK